MTADDLKNYRAIERAVVRGTYRGYDIVSMPPPSSGGVALIEMLNILEGYDLAKLGRGEQSLHDMIEAMKRAYADRAVFMGDPDAVKMPVAGLHLEKIRRRPCAPASATRRRRRPTSAPASRPTTRVRTPRISRSSTATATRCRTPTR